MTAQTKLVATEAQTAMIDAVKELPSKSAQIRALHKAGHKNGEIAAALTVLYYPNGEKKFLYQHVRNVLNQKVKGE